MSMLFSIKIKEVKRNGNAMKMNFTFKLNFLLLSVKLNKHLNRNTLNFTKWNVIAFKFDGSLMELEKQSSSKKHQIKINEI